MTDLLTRLREGEGADRKLDREIHATLGQPVTGHISFTSSLDACIALAETVLPKQVISLTIGGNCPCTVFFPRSDTIGTHKSLCRAFLIALITAKEASHD